VFVKLIFFFLLQLWNEPNLKKISINGTNYAILADAVCVALKDKYPDELFIGPGLCRIDQPYLRTLFSNSALEYLDGIRVRASLSP
jgi:hypothetical protein